MAINQINPNKFYSAKQLADMGILPWNSAMTLTKILVDPKWADIFKPIIEQKKKNRRFFVKGENILGFLKLADEGKLT